VLGYGWVLDVGPSIRGEGVWFAVSLLTKKPLSDVVGWPRILEILDQAAGGGEPCVLLIVGRCSGSTEIDPAAIGGLRECGPIKEL
jgi:hypothetical protein